MSRPRSGLGLGSLIVALLIVLALGAGTVYAAIPNSNGKYYACYVKDTGVVKLINYPKVRTCPKGEKLIDWNAKGPAGPQGPQGAQGDRGPAGDQGPKGDQGPADWNAIPNIPAGFKDGVDAGGFVSNVVQQGAFVPILMSISFDIGPYSPNADVDFYVIPGTDGPGVGSEVEYVRRAGSNVYYRVLVTNTNAATVSWKLRARVQSEGIAPAALKQQLKNVKVTNKKVKRAE